MGRQALSKIPVIDFSSEDLKPGTSSWLSTRKAVCHALEEQGCFVAEVGNKISLEHHNKIFGTIGELFELPTETKMQNTHDKPYRGYINVRSVHESMGIDNATSLEDTQKFTNLMWPNGNDHFCESADLYAKIMAELDQTVTRMVFENYSVEKYYDSNIASTGYVVRFGKYKEHQNYDSKKGFPAHTDKSFTSIVQQYHANTLEVQTRDGEWAGFDSTPSSFVYMVGDAFQAWSNDRLRPGKHRIMMNGKKTIHFLALFTFNEGTIHVPEELVDEEHPLQYKPFDHIEYVRSEKGHGTENPIKVYCGV
uniref:Fe2OG dioxygenase domain-containing protein n=1 Tax=Fagus sylvatica TaxID=28930 RepID=A0A2N9F458_FAGSY